MGLEAPLLSRYYLEIQLIATDMNFVYTLTVKHKYSEQGSPGRSHGRGWLEIDFLVSRFVVLIIIL